jgi:hypothetical protein
MSRPIRITLSPTALDRNGIAAAQTLTAGSPEPILDGALATGYDVDAICVAQTTAGAAALLLNGVLGTGPHVLRGTAERLIFTSTSDNSGITFTVVGKDKDNQTLSEVVTGSAASQKVFSDTAFYSITSITSSGAVTGNVEVGVNGVATFATPQHVTIWATSDESGGSFVVTGTDREDRVITESIVGPTASATVVGTKNFKTVTHVLSPAAATGVEIGVDGTCESQWLPLNYNYGGDFNIGLGVDVSSGADLTYTIQHTFDDVYAATFTEDAATAFNHDTLANQTGNADGNYTNPPIATRVDVSAHTSGSLTYVVVQSGD